MQLANAAWIRYIHAWPARLTNIFHETEGHVELEEIGTVGAEEQPVDRVDPEDFDGDAILRAAKGMLFAVSPAGMPDYDTWIQTSRAEGYLERRGPEWFLGKRAAWRAQVRYWYALARAGPGPAEAPDLEDFSAHHPDAYRWALCREIVEREPIGERLLFFVPMPVGLAAFLRQLSMPEHAGTHDWIRGGACSRRPGRLV